MKIRLSLILLLMQFPPLAFALSSDRDQPLNVEADQVMINDKKGTMVYTGKARFTQGSIIVTADKVNIYSKNRKFSRAVAVGKPATFEQKLDDGKIVKAKARQMEYNVNNEQLILTDDAEVWQDNNHIRSDRIVYRLDTQVIDAKGNKSGSRVKITIQPDSLKDKQK